MDRMITRAHPDRWLMSPEEAVDLGVGLIVRAHGDVCHNHQRRFEGIVSTYNALSFEGSNGSSRMAGRRQGSFLPTSARLSQTGPKRTSSQIWLRSIAIQLGTPYRNDTHPPLPSITFTHLNSCRKLDSGLGYDEAKTTTRIDIEWVSA